MTPFSTASELYRCGNVSEALATLQCASGTDLFSRLILARSLEDSRDLDSAEAVYTDLLESFSSVAVPCPLGLLHYLGFISRTRSPAEALTLFDDLHSAESEHVTWDLYTPVALAVAWHGNPGEDRGDAVMKIFRLGIDKYKGERKIELILNFVEFLSTNSNNLKAAEFELSTATGLKTPKRIWEKWELILFEFNLEISILNKLKDKIQNENLKTKSGNEFIFTEDLSAVTENRETRKTVESYFLNSQNDFNQFISKFSINQIIPESAVLEKFLPDTGTPAAPGHADEDGDDFGQTDEELFVVYRPDLTKLMKFNPFDKFEIFPKPLHNLLTLLPPKPLRSFNNSYLAEACMRLLVSVQLPPLTVANELTYNMVDRKVREAVARQTMKPELAIQPKRPEEDGRVKKEEVFDPVEYYRSRESDDNLSINLS
jgi:hypothetical protein